MNMHSSQHTPPNIPFSDADFSSLAQLARREFGLALAPSKKPLVYSRLSRRLRSRDIDSFPAYLDLVQRPEEGEEKLELISALTTNVTSFFREEHHFRALREKCLTPLRVEAEKGRRIRIWSAGCSSGQEAYCIAMTALDSLPAPARRDLRILATDIDPQIVHKARQGSYPEEEMTAVPEDYARNWLHKDPAQPGNITMDSALRDMIAFGELNLIAPWPFQGPFDAIFCRNVAIYFDQETRASLIAKFYRYLAPGGYLMLGHSESIPPGNRYFKYVRPAIYRKRGVI